MKRILIIDDEEGMCWALEKALTQENYEVMTSTNGDDGLSIFNSEKIDLILLDIKIKDQNGLEILEQIRSKNTEVPVLVMTGYSSIAMALEAIDKGATGYLTKPLKISNLRETVRELLLGKSASDEDEAPWNRHHD